MIKHGPVDVIVLAAGEPRFDGGVLAELERQAATGTIRVLDAMILVKDESGVHRTPGYRGSAGERYCGAGLYFQTERAAFLTARMLRHLFEGMVPGSAVIALAIEHTWALALVNALYQAGVDVALNFRVPAPMVDEAMASLGLE